MGFRNDIETITEILVTMQSIDLKLEADVLSVILNINDEIRNANSMNVQHNECDVDNESVYCVRDLPLLFFNCKGLQLWLPNANYESATDSNVLIVKVKFSMCNKKKEPKHFNSINILSDECNIDSAIR